MECSIEDCSRKAKYAKTGWCQTHYHRWWRRGVTSLPKPKKLRSDLTYRGAHGRVHSTFGPASSWVCVSCGSPANEWAYDGTDESQRSELVKVLGVLYPVTYSVWPEYYMPMCFACHRKKDAGARSLRRTKCIAGHEMTPENTYTRPSRPGTRECRTCKDDEYVRRRLAMGKSVPSRGIYSDQLLRMLPNFETDIGSPNEIGFS